MSSCIEVFITIHDTYDTQNEHHAHTMPMGPIQQVYDGEWVWNPF